MLPPGEWITNTCHPPTSLKPGSFSTFMYEMQQIDRSLTKSFLFFSKLQAPWKLWLSLATSHELPILWSTLEILQRKKRSDLNGTERCFEEDVPVINTGEVLPSPEATDLTEAVTWSKYKMLGPLHLAYVFSHTLCKRNLYSVSLGQSFSCFSFFSNI